MMIMMLLLMTIIMLLLLFVLLLLLLLLPTWALMSATKRELFNAVTSAAFAPATAAAAGVTADADACCCLPLFTPPDDFSCYSTNTRRPRTVLGQ